MRREACPWLPRLAGHLTSRGFFMRELQFAGKQTFPIFFTYIFIGIAFGIMMTEAGYSAAVSVLSAVFVYAGSMQIVMVSLLRSGSSLLLIAVMTFFINGRHIFYGLGFIDRFRRMGWRYPYMVFSLTDETYSILCSVQYGEGIDPKRADFLIALLDHCYWILGCFLGSAAGRILPWDMEGIDFSATAFFLIVVLGQWKQSRSKLPTIIGLTSAILFYLILGPDYFLIPALSVSMVTLVILRDAVAGQPGGVCE